MEWFALLIPLVVSTVLAFLGKGRVVIIEVGGIIVIGVFFILICKAISYNNSIGDTEYWTSFAQTATYYESWNEKVGCRHPIYRTYTDSQGYTHTQYVGNQHSFDVDYHSAYWIISDNQDNIFSISKDEFEELAKTWNSRKFVDLHRHYYTKDGDKYTATYDQKKEHIRIIVSAHSYTNKVQNSNTILSYKEVTPEEVREYGLYKYPELSNNFTSSIIGTGATLEETKELDYINATFGATDQIRVWILLYDDKLLTTGLMQEAYWKNGNKNELVICIGLKDFKITWCHTFSWTDYKDIVVGARDQVLLNLAKTPDITALCNWLETAIPKSWKRKKFQDFDYLDVPLSNTALTWLYILVVLSTVISSAFAWSNDLRVEN